MTRFLANELTKTELTENDLEISMVVLRQKCLVGIMEEKRESFARIQKYFKWSQKNKEEHCLLEQKMDFAWPMIHDHPMIEENLQAW